jgi:translocation and assembly module TamB
MLDRSAAVDSRARRWPRRVLAGVGGLVVLVVLIALTLTAALQRLERPFIKRRLQVLALDAAGVELDYQTGRIDLSSGLALEGVVVRAPLEVRAYAAELVRVGRLTAHWSLRSMLFGQPAAPLLEGITVSDVALNVVVDEHGRTSFDALRTRPSAPAQAPLPLSKQAAKILSGAPPLGKLTIERITLTLIRTAQGALFDRMQLRGLGVSAITHPAEAAARGFRVQAALGTNAAPLPLQLSRSVADDTRSARAQLWLTLDASASSLTAALDLRMLEQTFAASVSAERWLHADASVRFEPAAGRTQLSLEHVAAGDRAVLAEASIELPDAGDPIVHHAQAELDLARLLGWLPPGIVPASAERARLHCRIDGLIVGPVPRLSDSGAATLDAELANVALSAPTGPLRFERGALTLHLQPSASKGMTARGSLQLGAAGLKLNEERLDADELSLDFDGEQSSSGLIDARIGLRFGRFQRQALVTRAGQHAAAPPLVARQGLLELRLHQLQPDRARPLASAGDLALSLELSALDLRSPSQARAHLDGLSLHGHSALTGHAPYAGELDAHAARISVFGSDGKLVANTPARIDVRARDLEPDLVDLAASRGELHAALDLGDINAALDASNTGNSPKQHGLAHRSAPSDTLDYALHLNAGSLKAVRPFLSPGLIDAAAWDRMGVTLASSGRIEHLTGVPVLQEKTQLDLQHPSFEGTAARSASLKLESHGSALQHHVELDLHAQGLQLNAGEPSDDHLTLVATLDRSRPALQFQLGSEGRATTQLSGSLSFDRAQRALAYALDGRLAGLGPLAPFAAKLHGLEALDLSQLEIAISSQGSLFGAIADIARDGTLQLEADPARSAFVEGTTDLRLAHVRWAKGDTVIVAPLLAWHADMHGSPQRSGLDSRLEVGTLHVDLGNRDLDLNGIDDRASLAIIGSLVEPELEITQRLAIRAVEQTIVPEYPLGELVFDLTAERAPDGVVHISDLKVANGKGGTDLAVNGNVDLSDGRHTLSVTTTLGQDLAKIATIPERFKGTGKLAIEANVTSPDFALYRVRAAVKGENVSVALGRAGYDVQNANGEVPITVELEAAPGGVRFERSDKRNPYSMLRFADQHPLLSRSGFLSIARLQTPFVVIEPLVGNLEIDQNVVSLRQFEMGMRGGSITGQCGLDWDGLNSTLELHVRANGVKSTHGEPFDGNIAVAISAADRTIDGRAEILRIGERHLLDLLNLQDPLRVDPAMNRVRGALAFGYPKTLRLIFDHGFASAHLELGGLARFVSISELRGIPMGPIIDKMLARMLDGRDVKEMP